MRSARSDVNWYAIMQSVKHSPCCSFIVKQMIHLQSMKHMGKGAAAFWPWSDSRKKKKKANKRSLHSQVWSVVGPFLPGSCQIWITSHECSLLVAKHINLGSTHLSYASHLWERASVNLAVLVVSINRREFLSFSRVPCFIRGISVVYCAGSCQHWRASPEEAPLGLGGRREGCGCEEEQKKGMIAIARALVSYP